MKFARMVFRVAGVWGFLILTPLYFLFDEVGRQYPPAITHPDFYYGFLAVTIVWQLTFLLISTDPIRLRPIMPAAVLEKAFYIGTMVVLYGRGHLQLGQLWTAVPDGILGILFVVSYVKTPRWWPADPLVAAAQAR